MDNVVYDCENFAAESYCDSGGYFIQADLIDSKGVFYRRARVAQCTNLPEAIRYARDRNLKNSVIQASHLYNLIREYS